MHLLIPGAREIQNILEEYYESLDARLKTYKPAPQSSMIIMDQYNGDILGIVGATGKKQGELLQTFDEHGTLLCEKIGIYLALT